MTLWASRVKEERKRLGLSQAQLAAQVDISRNYLSQIELGKAGRVSHLIVIALNTALGIDPYTPVTDSPSLIQFARATRLPEADARMLAGIRYRGRQPESVEGWRVLYAVVKAVCIH